MENFEKNYETPKQDTGLATLIHLSALAKYILPFMGIIAPLLIWKLKNEQESFIEENAKSVINFQISTLIYTIILFFIGMLFFGGTILNYIQLAINDSINEDFVPVGLITSIVIGIGILAFWSIADFVLTIIGAVKANNGTVYQYPFTIKILK